MSKPSMPGPRPIFETDGGRDAGRAPPPVLTLGLIASGMRRAWKLGLLIVTAFVLLGFVYAVFLRPHSYMATAVIEPPINTGSQLSGTTQMLASFAGIESNNSTGAQFTKYLQVLGSTRFAARLDKDHGAMKLLIPGWDEETHSWKAPSGPITDFKNSIKAALGMPPWSPPDATSFAEMMSHILKITLVPGKSPLDLRSQVFEVSVIEKNPQRALDLLSWSLKAADDIVREDQLARTVNRIAYLKSELNTTEEVYLRQSLQQILMSQEEALMTLQADKFYAVDFIDRPNVSTKPIGLSVTTILAIAAVLGFLVFMATVAVVLFRRIRSPRASEADPLVAPFPDPIGAALGRLRLAFH